jgi:hypothetical protein
VFSNSLRIGLYKSTNGSVYTQGGETGTDRQLRQRSDYVAPPLSLNGLPAGPTERSLSPTYDTHVALGLGYSELGCSELGCSELGFSELGYSELGCSELGCSELGLDGVCCEV